MNGAGHMRARGSWGRAAVVAAAAAVILGAADAGAVDLNAVIDPGLTGTNEKYDGWAGLTVNNYPGYGTFTSSADPWGGAAGPEKVIVSNQPGSAGGAAANKAALAKVSGFGYPAGESLYLGGTGDAPGGTFKVTEAHPAANLASVVLQIEFGEAAGTDFTALPTLTYNNGTALPAAAYKGGFVRTRQQNGTFFVEETGEEAPVYVNSWAFQWDTRGLPAGVTDFKVQWAGEAHSQIYALRLDQSDAFTTVVPEPGAVGIVGAAAALALGRRRRR